MSKIAIIGFGSIGKRHYTAFQKLDHEVAVVSKQKLDLKNTFYNIEECLNQFAPDHVLICNKTYRHLEAIETLAGLGYTGNLYVEKPLFANSSTFPKNHFKSVFVTYNLRFNPLIQRIKEEIPNQEIVSINAYCGQFLPTWRPNQDYRNGYSAKAEQGGGVLRDLSHELDYVQWIAGRFTSIFAQGGHHSSLEINSDDIYSILATSEACQNINISINYLDHSPQRFIIVNCNTFSLYADLIHGTLKRDGSTILIDNSTDTYLEQAYALLESNYNLCSLEEGMQVVNTINACEVSSKNKELIRL